MNESYYLEMNSKAKLIMISDYKHFDAWYSEHWVQTQEKEDLRVHQNQNMDSFFTLMVFLFW